MLRKFIYRTVVSASAFCLVHSVSTAAYAQVSVPQVKASVPEQSMNTLLFLEARTIEVESQFNYLSEAANSINDDFAIAQSSPANPAGITLDSIPLLSELLNAEGNFDFGMDLPVAFNVGSVMGETGLILSTDFVMD